VNLSGGAPLVSGGRSPYRVRRQVAFHAEQQRGGHGGGEDEDRPGHAAVHPGMRSVRTAFPMTSPERSDVRWHARK
jgi:hypothetical protein